MINRLHRSHKDCLHIHSHLCCSFHMWKLGGRTYQDFRQLSCHYKMTLFGQNISCGQYVSSCYLRCYTILINVPACAVINGFTHSIFYLLKNYIFTPSFEYSQASANLFSCDFRPYLRRMCEPCRTCVAFYDYRLATRRPE